MKRLTENDKAVIEAAQAVLKNHVRETGMQANDPSNAVLLARNEIALAGAEREHFLVLFLNSRHKFLKAQILFSGGIDGAEIHPRVVIQKALEHNAAAIILAHNHPSGEVAPSAADHAATQRLKQALALIDIRLLDHLIITDKTHVSFAEKGWL